MIALIPARGGSKRLPGKNIKLLAGKPLIAHTIETAFAARSISRVIVSTDSSAIAEVAVAYGAEVPFLRPPHLATDDSLAVDTFIYAINSLSALYKTQVEELVVLQPTSPLRAAEDIDNAVDIFLSRHADSVLSYVRASHPISWYCRVNDDGTILPILSYVGDQQNGQSEQPLFLPNGALYVLRSEFLTESRQYYSNRSYPYIMPACRSVDIDTELDFDFAEFLMLKRAVTAQPPYASGPNPQP